MKAQEAYEIAQSNATLQLETVLKQIKRAAESGKFEYTEYKDACTDTTVQALRERGYFVEIGPILVKIHWDLDSICKSHVEKD